MRYIGVAVWLLTCLCVTASCFFIEYDYEMIPDTRSGNDYESDLDIFEEDPTENTIPSVESPEDCYDTPQPDSTDSESSSTETRPKIPVSTDDFHPYPNVVTVEQLNEKVDSLLSKMKSQRDKITILEKLNTNLLDKVDLLEQQIKTNNIIFFNVTENKHESHRATLQKVLHVMNRIMKVNVNAGDISVALRGGSNSTRDRPIVVKLTNFATKMKVLGARSKLSHTNIVVTGDYSEQVTKRRSELLPYMYKARGQGYEAFLLYDKLVVNNKVKTLDELQAEDRAIDLSQSQDQDVEEIDLP